MIDNGDFSDKLKHWFKCSSKGSSKVKKGSLRVSKKGCVSQEFAVKKNLPYLLECEAKVAGMAQINLIYKDKKSKIVRTAVQDIKGKKFKKYTIRIATPSKSMKGEVRIVSEGKGVFDNCSVILDK